jgi:hypothetical protein
MGKMQSRGLKFIYDDTDSTYEELLTKSKLPTLKIRRIRTIAIETFKIGNKTSPLYLHDLITRCNCSCFQVDQEMDAILLIISIVYGVCRIVIKSVQQCTYFLFSVNLLLVDVNYGQRTISFKMMK